MKLSKETKNKRKHYSTWFHNCPNCKQRITGGHFVPPSLGEKGFYICEELAGEKTVDIPPESVKLAA